MKISFNNTFIIAEIGNNHEGSFLNAKKLISKASEAGVNAVKFQTSIPEDFYEKNNTQRLDTLNKFSLSKTELKKLSKFAQKKKLIFFSTPFDFKSAAFLNKIQPIFKISSGDNNFTSFIEKIASYTKPLIISTGATKFKDIVKIKKTVDRIWLKKKYFQKLILLHCITQYPTKLNNANLNTIHKLKKKFPNDIIGYSDHTKGINASIFAVACGAKVIEKHFTLDHNFSKFRDHQISANPKELKKLVKRIRVLEKILGRERSDVFKNEEPNTISMRRSIASSKVIKKNEKITLNKIKFLRPGTGLSIEKVSKILGKKTKNLVEKNVFLKIENLI